MFRDGFYSAGEGLEALGFCSNLRGGKTAANLTPNSARASAASFGSNLTRKTVFLCDFKKNKLTNILSYVKRHSYKKRFGYQLVR